MSVDNQKWWVRWHTLGDDSRPVTFPTPIEWWCTGYSDTHAINCAIVFAATEPGVETELKANGWPECDGLDFCEPKDDDWRPNAGRFPPKSASAGKGKG